MTVHTCSVYIVATDDGNHVSAGSTVHPGFAYDASKDDPRINRYKDVIYEIHICVRYEIHIGVNFTTTSDMKFVYGALGTETVGTETNSTGTDCASADTARDG